MTADKIVTLKGKRKEHVQIVAVVVTPIPGKSHLLEIDNAWPALPAGDTLFKCQAAVPLSEPPPNMKFWAVQGS